MVTNFLDRQKRATPCECRICQYSRRITAVKERGDVEEMRRLIEELSEDLWNTEEELSVSNAILEGSWPSSEQWAKRILEQSFYARLMGRG